MHVDLAVDSSDVVGVDVDAAGERFCAPLPIHPLMLAPVEQLPSKQEAERDTAQVLRSLRTLSRLLLTSSTFRLILSDIFVSMRESVADAAADLSYVIDRVGAAVKTVEEVARPDGGDTSGWIDAGAPTVEEGATRTPDTGPQQSQGGTKEVVIARIQQVSESSKFMIFYFTQV